MLDGRLMVVELAIHLTPKGLSSQPWEALWAQNDIARIPIGYKITSFGSPLGTNGRFFDGD
jgi:hypothetical protein